MSSGLHLALYCGFLLCRSDYCDTNNSYLRTFRAALVLLDIYKMKVGVAVTLRRPCADTAI